MSVNVRRPALSTPSTPASTLASALVLASTLEHRGQDQEQDLGCPPSPTAIDLPSSLVIPPAPLFFPPFRLSAFAYLRPGRPSFCQGPHKTSNFDFRGARPLLQIYKYLYACIKFRGRLPFSAVCESSATKPLVCDVFFKPT